MHVCTTLAFLLSCTVLASAADASRSTLQYSTPLKGQPPDPLALKDGVLVSHTTGAGINLKAAVWGLGPASEPFSSFVHASRPEGTGNSSTSRALVSAAYQLRKQGYNAVYLPFVFSDWRDATSGSSSRTTGQQQKQQGKMQRCEQLCLTCLDQRGPGFSKAAAGRSSTLESGGLLQHSQDSSACQSVLPNTTTLDRYLWSVQWFIANGLYVVMASSGGTGDGRTAGPLTPQEAAAAWAELWRAVVALPDFEAAFKGRVMLQLALDPVRQRWEPTTSSNGRKTAGLQETYLAIMDAVDRVMPKAALFILQGPQQLGPAGSSTAQWGSGFSADPGLLRLGVTDPTPLFKALMTKPYRNQVILSQWVWGSQAGSSSVTDASATAASPDPAAATAEVSDEQAAADGAARVKVLDNAFHQLSSTGFCMPDGTCLQFPVVAMQQQHQAGPALQDQAADRDVQLFADFVLSRQSGTGGAAEEVATGHWYHWDTMVAGTTATTQPPTEQPQGRRGDSTAPTTDAAAATTADGRGSGKDGHGEVLTFVYAADSRGDDGEVYSVRELQAQAAAV